MPLPAWLWLVTISAGVATEARADAPTNPPAPAPLSSNPSFAAADSEATASAPNPAGASTADQGAVLQPQANQAYGSQGYWTPAPSPPKRRFFFGAGFAAAAYFADGDSTSGSQLDAYAGMSRGSMGFGARIALHTPAEYVTFTHLLGFVRIPISASQRAYLEPFAGLSFYRFDNTGFDADIAAGLALGVVAGYELARFGTNDRLSIDVRGGLDRSELPDNTAHSRLFIGLGGGFR